MYREWKEIEFPKEFHIWIWKQQGWEVDQEIDGKMGVREDRRIVGGEGWQEKLHNRDEWKKILRSPMNRRNLHMTMEFIIIIIIITIIIIIIVSFTHGSHTHIPKTNHVPRGYIVAAILSLLFMVPLSLVPALALLFFYVSTFRSMCAVPSMAVFCSSLTSWFPGMSLTYFLNDFGNGPSRSSYYWYHPCFYIPHALYFYCELFIF